MFKMKINKIKIFGLIFGFLLIVGLLGVQITKAWEPPPDGTPPDPNVDEPLNAGNQDQYKTGTLTLGIDDTSGPGKLNICELNSTCSICLNGICIGGWPPGGGPGSNSLWGESQTLPFIYPIIGGSNINNFRVWDSSDPLANYALSTNGSLFVDAEDGGGDGDLLVGQGDIEANNGNLRINGYGRLGDYVNNTDVNWSLMAGDDNIASGFYVKARDNAITAEVANNPAVDLPDGRGAIIGRDDSVSSNDNIIWGVLGMAGGGTSPTPAANYGVYGSAPNNDMGIGVGGFGKQTGVFGGSNGVGVWGTGGNGVLGTGSPGVRGVAILAGGYGGFFTADDGGLGGYFRAKRYTVGAFGPIDGKAVHADLYENASGIEAIAAQGFIGRYMVKGSYYIGGIEVPDEDSYAGVVGISDFLPVAGFNSEAGHKSTYGVLGRHSAEYGGYIGAFGHGTDFGVYGFSETGTGIFACSGSNCSGKQPTIAEKYGLYANNTNPTKDAIKGECDSCESAIAGIHHGNGNGIYGESPDDSSGWAGYFNGAIYVNGRDTNDGSEPDGSIAIEVGSGKAGDTVIGTKNLWLWAGDGTTTDEPSVRIKDKLEVEGDLAVNGDHIKLTDGQNCSGLAAPSGGGAWAPMGTITYLRPPAPGTDAYKTLCVVTTGIQWN
ncbi:MAG: hypothetical protein V1684_00810 [bacterium]